MNRFRSEKEIEELRDIVDKDLASDEPPEFYKKLFPVLRRFDRELTGTYRRFRHGFKTVTGCETDYRIIVEHPDLGGFVLDATGRHPFSRVDTTDDSGADAPTGPSGGTVRH